MYLPRYIYTQRRKDVYLYTYLDTYLVTYPATDDKYLSIWVPYSTTTLPIHTHNISHSGIT